MEDKAHIRNTRIFYVVLMLGFVLCFAAIYQNLYVDKNFRQFTPDDEEPVPTDFYLYQPNSSV